MKHVLDIHGGIRWLSIQSLSLPLHHDWQYPRICVLRVPRVDEVVGVIGQNGLFRVATLYFESRTADLMPADGGEPQLKGILWGALQPPQLKD